MIHVIRNFDALAMNDVRRDALCIAEAGYAAIDIGAAFERKVSAEGDELSIGDIRRTLAGRRVFFVGIGKCARAAAEIVERLLGERLTAGIALYPEYDRGTDVRPEDAYRFKKIEACAGTHPEPSGTNADAAKKIVELLSGLREEDLVLMLVSGGGSTLLCLPDPPMGPYDERTLFDALTAKGADIRELNVVRKHLSRARGGWLAEAAYPAEVVSLVVSDVPGNDVGSVSSGPTVRDDSTVEDAEAVLARYGINAPADTVFIETPKDEKYFTRVENILFLTNHDALAAMQAEAMRLGYGARIANDAVCGEARDVARAIIGELRDTTARTALLYGGETTVTLNGERGSGGRNQELALAALGGIGDDELVLAFASDGRDDTDHAGALVDPLAKKHAAEKRVSIPDYLVRHDSYAFFNETSDFVETGALESNVSDLAIAIKT